MVLPVQLLCGSVLIFIQQFLHVDWYGAVLSAHVGALCIPSVSNWNYFADVDGSPSDGVDFGGAWPGELVSMPAVCGGDPFRQ